MATETKITGEELVKSTKQAAATTVTVLKDLESKITSADSANDLTSALQESVSEGSTDALKSLPDTMADSVDGSIQEVEAETSDANAVGRVIDKLAGNFAQTRSLSNTMLGPTQKFFEPISAMTSTVQKFLPFPIFSSFHNSLGYTAGFGYDSWTASPAEEMQMSILSGVSPADYYKSKGEEGVKRKLWDTTGGPFFKKVGETKGKLGASLWANMKKMLSVLGSVIASKYMLYLAAAAIVILGVVLLYKRFLKKPTAAVDITNSVDTAVTVVSERVMEEALNEGILDSLKKAGKAGFAFIKKLVVKAIQGLRSLMQSIGAILSKVSKKTVVLAVLVPTIIAVVFSVITLFKRFMSKAPGGK